MFPLTSNEAYIKSTGERSTLGKMLEGEGGSDLPEYSEEDAGKVLSVNNSGELEWADLPASENRYEAPKVSVNDNLLSTSAEGGTT